MYRHRTLWLHYQMQEPPKTRRRTTSAYVTLAAWLLDLPRAGELSRTTSEVGRAGFSCAN
jgi:hypothetical protein